MNNKISIYTQTFIVLLTLLYLSPAILFAQSSNTLWTQASDAYAQNDFQKSVELYEQILANGEEAFEVYYNLGNAYFKMDQIAAAILNYERAAKVNPSDVDLRYNLRLANDRTIDRIDMIAVPEFVSAYKSSINVVSADQWAFWSIVSFVLFLILIIVFLIVGQIWLKRLALVLGLAFLLGTFTFLLFAGQQQSWLNSSKEAIIFEPSLEVRSAPNRSSATLFVLHEGTKVRIEEKVENWLRIRIGDGNTGWVQEETIEAI